MGQKGKWGNLRLKLVLLNKILQPYCYIILPSTNILCFERSVFRNLVQVSHFALQIKTSYGPSHVYQNANES